MAAGPRELQNPSGNQGILDLTKTDVMLLPFDWAPRDTLGRGGLSDVERNNEESSRQARGCTFPPSLMKLGPHKAAAPRSKTQSSTKSMLATDELALLQAKPVFQLQGEGHFKTAASTASTA